MESTPPIAGGQGKGGAGLTERADRILDSAAILLIQWGYKRITISDIAQHAGIGTGTVYLHWKSKETLFESVLLRELQLLWGGLIQRVEADPREATLHRLLSALLRAIKLRPIACALFTRDTLMLGKLTQRSLIQQQSFIEGTDLLALLRELGLLRADVDPSVQLHTFSALWTGFVLVDQLLPPKDRPSLDVQTEALISTVQRTLEPDTPPDEAWMREHAAPKIRALLEQAHAYAAEQIGARVLS
ncbi:TetR/AcrR family transcriptional regulator [Chloroflexia bacterium SDU3-3]|nr:TetR/AcrR family transcriptional regulator [Chloroflexia bacterium SDU3-3]